MASGSYGYNEYGAGQGGFGLGTGINYMNTIDGKLFPANRPIKEAEVAVPSDLIVLGDGFTSSSLNNIRHSNFLGRNSNSAGLSNEMNLAQARHQGSLNVVFGGGHVEANKIHKLFFDMSDEALRRWNLDHCVFLGNSDSDFDLIRTLIPIHFGQAIRCKSDSDSDLNSDTLSGSRNRVRKGLKLFTRSTGATLDKSAPSGLFENEKVTNGTTQHIHASDQRKGLGGDRTLSTLTRWAVLV